MTQNLELFTELSESSSLALTPSTENSEQRLVVVGQRMDQYYQALYISTPNRYVDCQLCDHDIYSVTWTCRYLQSACCFLCYLRHFRWIIVQVFLKKSTCAITGTFASQKQIFTNNFGVLVLEHFKQYGIICFCIFGKFLVYTFELYHLPSMGFNKLFVSL